MISNNVLIEFAKKNLLLLDEQNYFTASNTCFIGSTKHFYPIEKLDVENDIKNDVKKDVKNGVKNDVKNYVRNEVKNWDSFLRHF